MEVDSDRRRTLTGMEAVVEELTGLLQNATAAISGGNGLVERVGSLREAVEWTEPLIVGLAIFHCCILLLAVVSCVKGWFKIQSGVLLSIVGLVFVSERLNTHCTKHWRSIATQEYFEPTGFFIALFWAAPLLAIGFLMVVMMTASAAHLLIKVKRHELRQHHRRANESQGDDNAQELTVPERSTSSGVVHRTTAKATEQQSE